jgi:D-glutamate N-acetyltransferase
VLLAAIAAGLSVEAGLHTQLSEDPELRRAATRAGVALRDLRAAPADLTVPEGPYSRPDSVRVVHSVGSDTVIGKKVVTLELDRAARERGERSVYVPTGQTGVAIAGWGIAVDHVISDYVAGAGERLVKEGSARGDLLFVEGQGGLFHPAYSGVTLGLLHGSAPDLLVLVHKAGATALRNYPDLPIPPLAELVAAYERVAAPVRPARVAAIALNTADLSSDEEARAAIEAAQTETGLVADDVVRFGPERVLDAVLAALSAAVTAR